MKEKRSRRVRRNAILYLRLFRVKIHTRETTATQSTGEPNVVTAATPTVETETATTNVSGLKRFLMILCRTLIHLLLPILPTLIRRIRQNSWSSCETS